MEPLLGPDKENEKLRARDLKKLMQTRTVTVEMSEAEVLLIHTLSVFTDGRKTLTKIFRRRITPVALQILEQREEYQ